MKKVGQGFGSLTPSVFLENTLIWTTGAARMSCLWRNIGEKVSVLFCSMNEKHYLYKRNH